MSSSSTSLRLTSKDGIEEMANRPYRELVGALAWLALDIVFDTSSLADFAGCVHGMWPNDYHATSRAPNSGVSRWEASPHRSLSSQTLTGEVTATTDAHSERILSRLEMGSSAGSPRSGLASRSRGRKRSTWRFAKRRRNRYGTWRFSKR